jgi:hypothetical protein
LPFDPKICGRPAIESSFLRVTEPEILTVYNLGIGTYLQKVIERESNVSRPADYKTC